MSVSRLGTTPSATRLARGRDHHCPISLVTACILWGTRPLGTRTVSRSLGFAALTVATVFCTASTGAGGPVDLKRSGRWATVESRECVSACVTAPSAANDSTTECRGEPGMFLKTGLRTKGVAGATKPPAFGCGVGAAGNQSARYEPKKTKIGQTWWWWWCSAAEDHLVILSQGEQGRANERRPQRRAMFLVSEHSSSASTRNGAVILCEVAKLYIAEMYVVWIAACNTRNEREQGVSSVSCNSQGL